LLERSSHDLALFAAASPSLAVRRASFLVLVVATTAGMLWLMAGALPARSFGVLDAVVLFLFAMTLPWIAIGFWNSLIGFLLLRFARDSAAAVTPVATRIRGDEPVTGSTAILMCIRNEAPDRVIRNLESMMADLVAAGVADRFHLYVLSDTSQHDIADFEQAQLAALAERWHGRLPLTYRRRALNTGFKAGNIHDFCEHWGDQHELAVVLDSDSLMPAPGILRLVRIMQANPKLGILQSLVVALPSTSAFARLFQFGMRMSMRSYTIGAAWWQGDCGPYWGHNAVVRLAPFTAHCRLPVLKGPFGGQVLSHDQIEGSFMRRAGYEVRVLCEENLGWEENPPTLIEFSRRDLRWCQGNMQYWTFLAWPGLKTVSRYQLILAILMFLGSPAWLGMIFIGTLMTAFATKPADIIHANIGIPLFVLGLLMWFTPILATALDILLRSDERRAFGGITNFCTSLAAAIGFNILLVPIMWISHTIFLTSILFGRSIGWSGQVRDDHSVPIGLAVHNFWPHTLIGLAVLGVLAATEPSALCYASFIVGGPALSIPLAVFTALPAVGRALVRCGIGRLPEETDPPAMLIELALPAIALSASRSRAA
jgi:membrane glycosyltransferase